MRRAIAFLLPVAALLAATMHLVHMARGVELRELLPAFAGSVALVVLAGVIAVPLGVAAAIYLQEYAPPGRFSALIEWNIGTLAGVPSIVYGLFGLELFVRALGAGRSLLAGALTLAALALPMIVIASREALRQVPSSYREAAFALGATRLEALRYVVLPMGARGIATGIVLTLGMALGEAAPLLVVGGFASGYTALPLQIFHWLARPEPQMLARAAAAMLVLLVLVLGSSVASIVIRASAR